MSHLPIAEVHGCMAESSLASVSGARMKKKKRKQEVYENGGLEGLSRKKSTRKYELRSPLVFAPV